MASTGIRKQTDSARAPDHRRTLYRHACLAGTLIALQLSVGCVKHHSDPSTIDRRAGVAIDAVADNQADHRNGRFIGTTIGAIASTAVDSYMNDQQRRLEQQLVAERTAASIRLERLDSETLRLELDTAAGFEFGSDRVRSGFRDSLTKLAETLEEYDRTAVVVHGHTDNTGTAAYNQQLSARRATAVTRYLVRNGVKRERTRTAGHGEHHPIDDNTTRMGRARNRRVTIYLRSFVKGRELKAFSTSGIDSTR